MSNPPQIKRCKACDGTGYFMTEEELSAPDNILFPVGQPADECKVCDGMGYVDIAPLSLRDVGQVGSSGK